MTVWMTQNYGRWGLKCDWQNRPTLNQQFHGFYTLQTANLTHCCMVEKLKPDSCKRCSSDSSLLFQTQETDTMAPLDTEPVAKPKSSVVDRFRRGSQAIFAVAVCMCAKGVRPASSSVRNFSNPCKNFHLWNSADLLLIRAKTSNLEQRWSIGLSWGFHFGTALIFSRSELKPPIWSNTDQ